MRGSLLALESMGANKGGEGGVIVNISSIAGLKVVPFGPVYAASKSAIVGLTRSLGVRQKFFFSWQLEFLWLHFLEIVLMVL